MASHRRPSKADVMELHEQASFSSSRQIRHIPFVRDKDAVSRQGDPERHAWVETTAHAIKAIILCRLLEGICDRQEGLCMALLTVKQAYSTWEEN